MKTFFVLLLTTLVLVSCKKKEEAQPQSIQESATLLYETTFHTATWPTAIGNHFNATYDNNQYFITIDTANYIVWQLSPYRAVDSNYLVEVDISINLTDSKKWGYAGIIYNYVNNSNYSVFRICPNGTFNCYQMVDGNFSVRFYPTFTSAIKTGNGVVNTLAIKQKKETQEFFINNVSLGSYLFPKETLPVKFGVAMCSEHTDFFTPLNASFSRFVIKKLD